jgi:8-amino-7-oxononanoate synthase
MAWTNFVFQHMQQLHTARQQLHSLAHTLQQGITDLGLSCPSSSHIVPVIIGDANTTVYVAEQLQQHGFYVLAVRPPTVPANTSRLRICLHQQVQLPQVTQLLECLRKTL